MAGLNDEPMAPAQTILGAEGVQWSSHRDHAAGNLTALEAVATSGYREDFERSLALFMTQASQHETVIVMWWHAPYIYVEVKDSRLKYPACMRALASFDLTNGRWASWHSGKRYVFARRGWGAFMDRLAGRRVARYAG